MRRGFPKQVRVLLLLFAAALISGSALAQPYGDYRQMSCSELWYARNAIYAEAGYCFRTERAIEVFGPGCFPPYGRLTRAEQDEVSRIQYWERRRRCPK